MMRLYEEQIVYVKKEHLEDFIPNTFAEKYDRLYKRRAKVLEWQIDGGPGVKDPMMVRVQMLEDGEIWFLPIRMIFCLPVIDYGRGMDGDPKGEFKAMKYEYKPLKIIYNDPATIVFWRDGTKTVVKRMEKEKFNPYTAFCAALAKKLFGSNSAVNRIVNSGYNQLVGDILKAGKKAKTKEKAEPKFVRDEKGRWVSAKAKKKKK